MEQNKIIFSFRKPTSLIHWHQPLLMEMKNEFSRHHIRLRMYAHRMSCLLSFFSPNKSSVYCMHPGMCTISISWIGESLRVPTANNNSEHSTMAVTIDGRWMKEEEVRRECRFWALEWYERRKNKCVRLCGVFCVVKIETTIFQLHSIQFSIFFPSKSFYFFFRFAFWELRNKQR